MSTQSKLAELYRRIKSLETSRRADPDVTNAILDKICEQALKEKVLKDRIDLLELNVTELWHQGEGDYPLSYYLGLSEEEYKKWVAQTKGVQEKPDNRTRFYTAAVALSQVNPCEGCKAESPDVCHSCVFVPSMREEGIDDKIPMKKQTPTKYLEAAFRYEVMEAIIEKLDARDILDQELLRAKERESE